MSRMLRVGLTGGIASGKSTVARIFTELGAYVIDADRLAREVLRRGGSAYADVVARFGRGILDRQGRIDRPALADEVFRDTRARRDLNAIVHPKILAEVERRFVERERRGDVRLAIFNAALLVESGAYRDFERLVVVRCGRQTQLRRLEQRDGMTAEQATARIDAQAPLEVKVAAADYVIDTDGSLDDTRQATEAVFERLLADLGKRISEGP